MSLQSPYFLHLPPLLFILLSQVGEAIWGFGLPICSTCPDDHKWPFWPYLTIYGHLTDTSVI